MAKQPWWGPPDGQEGPLISSEPWDVVTFNDGRIVLPGVSAVQAKPTRDLDKKKAAGKDGSTNTYQGLRPCDVTISTKIWTPEQWDLYQEALETLWPEVGKGRPEAFKIYHPILPPLRIAAVMVIGVGTPSESDNGARTFPLYCHAFKPPTGKKSATRTPFAPVALAPQFQPNNPPSNGPQPKPSTVPSYTDPTRVP